MIVFINRLSGRPRISRMQAEQLEAQLQEPVVLADSAPDAVAQAPGAEIIVGFNPDIDAGLSDRFPCLRWVHSMTSGVDRLPLAHLAERGVMVTNSRGIHRTQIAEQMIGMMICFTRRLHVNIRNQRQGKWDVDYVPGQLSGKTIAIVGAGSIGGELARKCKAFDMNVMGLRRTAAPQEYFDCMETLAALPDVLPVSDFVAVLLPLMSDTHHRFGRAEFARMKSTAIFLNFARGGVVDEPSLVEALRNGEIGGAGLDVFNLEPLNSDHPLWRMEQVILSPHSAGLVSGLEIQELAMFRQLVSIYRRNGEMFNVVSPGQFY